MPNSDMFDSSTQDAKGKWTTFYYSYDGSILHIAICILKETWGICVLNNSFLLKQNLLPPVPWWSLLCIPSCGVYICSLSVWKCFYDLVGHLGHNNHAVSSPAKTVISWYLFSSSYLYSTPWCLRKSDIIKLWRGGAHTLDSLSLL